MHALRAVKVMYSVVLDGCTKIAGKVLRPYGTVRNSITCAGVGTNEHGRGEGSTIVFPPKRV